MTPFNIIVAPIKIYAPDNQGPIIEGFVDSITIKALNETSFNFGTPIDIEQDHWYVSNWTMAEKGSLIPKQEDWVTFANNTDLISLDFTFNPPESSKGISYDLQITLQDTDSELP